MPRDAAQIAFLEQIRGRCELGRQGYESCASHFRRLAQCSDVRRPTGHARQDLCCHEWISRAVAKRQCDRLRFEMTLKGKLTRTLTLEASEIGDSRAS